MAAPRCAAWRAATSIRPPALLCQAAAHLSKSKLPSDSGLMRPALTARLTDDLLTPR
jgi:hypothetical protein